MCSAALGAPYHLFDYGYNLEGKLTLSPASAPQSVSDSAFDYETGLGSIYISASGTGPHYIGMFVDHEIDASLNSFFNEYGEPVDSPLALQSWEIDEPGYTFGNLLANFQKSRLDNSTGVTSGNPDDVAMAMAWNLSLDAGQTALIRFDLSDEVPTAGFYLRHFDPDSNRSVYLSSSYRIYDGSTAVPESASTLGLCLAAMGLMSLGTRLVRSRRA